MKRVQFKHLILFIKIKKNTHFFKNKKVFNYFFFIIIYNKIFDLLILLIRFYDNENHFIISIGRITTLVNSHENEYHILLQLIMEKEIYTFTLVLYFFGLYNEESDTLSKRALFLVIFNNLNMFK